MKRLQLLAAVAMCIFGCALLSAAFALPLVGTIDSSVLVAFGEILTFVGSPAQRSSIHGLSNKT